MPMLNEKLDIHSPKYGITGTVKDYGMVTKLFFTYAGREHEVGIRRPVFGDLSETALQIMESCIDIFRQECAGDQVSLHYWHTERKNGRMVAKGIVSNHPKIGDTVRMTTAPVENIYFDEQEAVIYTENTIYHCPYIYWNFNEQDGQFDLSPRYDAIKEQFENKIEYPGIEPGNVLLVLSDFDEYYFHSLYCIPNVESNEISCTGRAHIGTFMDSYLIRNDQMDGKIDLRYYPHFRNIEFYSVDTDGMPLWVENIGSTTLYVRIHGWQIKLLPGQRKKMCEENAEKEKITLPNGDLYPAGIIGE